MCHYTIRNVFCWRQTSGQISYLMNNRAILVFRCHHQVQGRFQQRAGPADYRYIKCSQCFCLCRSEIKHLFPAACLHVHCSHQHPFSFVSWLMSLSRQGTLHTSYPISLICNVDINSFAALFNPSFLNNSIFNSSVMIHVSFLFTTSLETPNSDQRYWSFLF